MRDPPKHGNDKRQSIGNGDFPFSKLTVGTFFPDSGKPKMRLKAAAGRHFLKVL